MQILKALSSTVIHILQERLNKGVIEPSHGFYQNPWYLVKKSTAKNYWLVTMVVELQRVTVRDVNLSLPANKFSEKFASCTISFFINFFSGYNQVQLDQKSRDLTVLMTSLGLMQIRNLPQDTTNPIAQFVKIVFKILASY